MMVLRPIAPGDLDDLEHLAQTTKGGITSLPPDRRLLHEKVERSLFAFSRDVMRPKGEAYLFVLEDLEQKRVVGCSGILSKSGGYEPLYSYKVKTQHFKSTYVEVDTKVQLLDLRRIHDGPTEVGSLYLLPNERKGGWGRLLSFSRFLFISLHRERFESEVAALLRGALDDRGVPLFWKSVCAPFFKIPFYEADALRYADPRYIEDLVPKHPLYVPLLPPEVQQIVGKTHETTRPALKLLQQEGFTFSKHVDIFDAGPTYTVKTEKLWSVQHRREASIGKVTDQTFESEPQIVCNHLLDFRACMTPIAFDDDGHMEIPRAAAEALQVEKGSVLSYREVRA